ncbi:MAG: hypothetical protein ACYTFY_09415 [Planctomycetota bacterium]|jgi:hypothetical protein
MTLNIDFCSVNNLSKKSLLPGYRGLFFSPEGEVDPRKGLAFPLRAGGFAFHSGKYINDAAGHVEIVFRLKEVPDEVPLVQAWGQYEPLIKLNSHGITAAHVGELKTAWQLDTEYRLMFDWDNNSGVTLSIRGAGKKEQVKSRRCFWKAFRQAHMPFAAGGMASCSRFKGWSGSFSGWIKKLVIDNTPQRIPGPSAAARDGIKIKSPIPAAMGITLISIDDRPITPDPLKLDQLPDRLSDLRKTRKVCKLDELTSHCRSELEIFSMLTWHLALLWPHSYYWPWNKDEQRQIFWKRGHEILPEIAEGRAGGMCGGYAHMMEEIFWAMGFDARRIQVRDHSSFEAYSCELDRWVICDASFNEACYLMSGPDKSPVGAREVIMAHEDAEHDIDALHGFDPLYCERENLKSGELFRKHRHYNDPPARYYDHIGIALRKTAQYGRDKAADRGDHSHAWYYQPWDRGHFTGKSTMGRNNQLVEDIDMLYPSRNRVEVKAEWLKKGEVLKLNLKPVGVTFFRHFEISINDKIKTQKEKQFKWQLNGGVNRLSIRTVNKLGCRGYPFSIKIYKKS